MLMHDCAESLNQEDKSVAAPHESTHQQKPAPASSIMQHPAQREGWDFSRTRFWDLKWAMRSYSILAGGLGARSHTGVVPAQTEFNENYLDYEMALNVAQRCCSAPLRNCEMCKVGE